MDASTVADQADGIGDDQPTPEPIETMPPEVIELEKRRTSEEGAEATFDVDAALSADDEIVMGEYNEATDTSPHEPQSVIDTSAYQFSAIVDENVDFTFNYPAQWENVPGIYTICYREKVEKGDFPARIAVTRKRLVHTPDDAALMDELSSYMKSIRTQYDKATFQAGTPNREDTFMGKQALSNTYLAYWGEIEVKGFIIGAAIDRTLYVMHFCASYGDYLALQNVMRYMIQSAKPREKES